MPPHARAGRVGRGHRFAAYPRCSTDNGSMTDQRTPARGAAFRAAFISELVLAVLAATMGAGVAWMDSRPKWDDTGVSVGMLLLVSGFAAGAGLRWWAAALLVAAPILIVELPSAGWGIAISLAVTGAGALLGATVRRVVAGGRVA